MALIRQFDLKNVEWNLLRDEKKAVLFQVLNPEFEFLVEAYKA